MIVESNRPLLKHGLVLVDLPGTGSLTTSNVDTPGYNSILVEHEEVLRQFLPQSDVVVFLVAYRMGFGQSDQDLLEVVRTVLEDDPEAPVLLVVNRVPARVGIENARVQEIVANARDSLWREPELFLVRTASEDIARFDGPVQRESALPDAAALWNRVVAIVAAPERQRAVEQTLVSALRELIDDADQALERRDLILTANQADVEMIEGQLRSLQVARTRSLDAVHEAAERMRSQLPASLERLAAGIKSNLNQDIEGSDKWLGRDECLAWLSAHAMPFEVRQAARSIEGSISVELQELDRRLAAIANTAVQKIRQSIHLRSEASRRFAENLARVVAQRLGGAGISALSRAFGGVGGAAAGAGNLVKMLVSRMGNLIGKTFSRQVFNQIGRTFTKRALSRLNVVTTVLIEVGVFVIEAQRWKGSLVAKVHEAVDGWAHDVRKELFEDYLPKIHANNVLSVCAIYDPLVEECQKALERRGEDVGARRERLAALRSELARLRAELHCAASEEDFK